MEISIVLLLKIMRIGIDLQTVLYVKLWTSMVQIC
nr:MAG TPA: hypothetical protein [Caudoviricetes sp.]